MSAARKMPVQKPGQSEQTVGTPPEFVKACSARFGTVKLDLAATKENAVALVYLGPGSNLAEDSLTTSWANITRGIAFLNPPFDDIGPWAEKCVHESFQGARILLLVPASVGADWFNAWLRPRAYIFELSPRLTFVGHTSPYPKDMVLAYFGPEWFIGRAYWRWKT